VSFENELIDLRTVPGIEPNPNMPKTNMAYFTLAPGMNLSEAQVTEAMRHYAVLGKPVSLPAGDALLDHIGGHLESCGGVPRSLAGVIRRG